MEIIYDASPERFPKLTPWQLERFQAWARFELAREFNGAVVTVRNTRLVSGEFTGVTVHDSGTTMRVPMLSSGATLDFLVHGLVSRAALRAIGIFQRGLYDRWLEGERSTLPKAPTVDEVIAEVDAMLSCAGLATYTALQKVIGGMPAPVDSEVLGAATRFFERHPSMASMVGGIREFWPTPPKPAAVFTQHTEAAQESPWSDFDRNYRLAEKLGRFSCKPVFIALAEAVINQSRTDINQESPDHTSTDSSADIPRGR